MQYKKYIFEILHKEIKLTPKFFYFEFVKIKKIILFNMEKIIPK